jgi:hypothetical protein
LTRKSGLLFREPLNNPIWMQRAAALNAAMQRRAYKTADLLLLGRVELGWSADETRQVLAAADGPFLYERGGEWKQLAPSAQPKPTVPKHPDGEDDGNQEEDPPRAAEA